MNPTWIPRWVSVGGGHVWLREVRWVWVESIESTSGRFFSGFFLKKKTSFLQTFKAQCFNAWMFFFSTNYTSLWILWPFEVEMPWWIPWVLAGVIFSEVERVNFVAIENWLETGVFLEQNGQKGCQKSWLSLKLWNTLEKLTIFFFGLLAQLNGLLVSRWRWFRNKTGSFF